MLKTFRLVLPLVFCAGLPAQADEPADRVLIWETTDGGIQPQAVVDAQGTVHLVYFKGTPAAGDLYYTKRQPGQESFTRPVKVNSQSGSAVAVGTIRGGQIALGRGGRLHVAWNGSQSARPKNPIQGMPMLYARSNESVTAFEAQRNLMQQTFGLDGGGTVAADADGHVFVAWHGKIPGAPDGEMGRKLWVARSNDDGATFASEQPALSAETGACGCCGARALADSKGRVYVLYRAASAAVNRDMILAVSRDHGEHYQEARLDRWNINACPMSSESLVEGPSGVLASWETKGQVYLAKIDPASLKAQPPVAPEGGKADRKHPALAVDAQGNALLVWTEGTGWQRGGSLAWQRFDASGQPQGPPGRIDGGVPVWGLATAVALPDGRFVIIH